MTMTRYNEALKEYNSADDDGKHKLIYAQFGLAVYFSQCLEETFSIMLSTDRVIKKKIKTNKEVNDIVDAIENSKKTMGVFIKEIKQSYNLPVQIKNELEVVLNQRNYIVHKFFKLEIQKVYSETGQKEIIKYFSDFIDRAIEIDEKLNVYYSSHMDKLGLTEERIEKLMQEIQDSEAERVKNKC